MSRAEATVISAIVFILYVLSNAALVVGWFRWVRHAQQRTLCSMLSLVGFALVTASALLGIPVTVYAFAFGGFAFHDALLLTIIAWHCCPAKGGSADRK
jgi:hypothetical protein